MRSLCDPAGQEPTCRQFHRHGPVPRRQEGSLSSRSDVQWCPSRLVAQGLVGGQVPAAECDDAVILLEVKPGLLAQNPGVAQVVAVLVVDPDHHVVAGCR